MPKHLPFISVRTAKMSSEGLMLALGKEYLLPGGHQGTSQSDR